MTTAPEALVAASNFITARSAEIEQLTEAGVFDRATADHRQAELIIVQGALGDMMEAEVAAARDAAERLGGEVE